MAINYKETRGWRNNNPLNIVKSQDQWQGMRNVQTDKRFVQFVHMSYGYRAAIKTLQSYYNLFKQQKKNFTIRNIIGRWCPDGSEAHYINTVTLLTGLTADQRLPEPCKPEAYRIFVLIMAAMTVQECGVPKRFIPWANIEGGYWLAYKIKDPDFVPCLK